MKKKYTLSILLIIVVLNCFSNNITISNTTLIGKNTTDNYVLVQFDLAWDNSWRTSSGPSNWDAAWVFIKFRIKGQTDWRHASLNWADGTGAGDGHTVPAGAVIKGDIDTGDGNSLGVFIYSSGNKVQSTATYPGVQLRWQYGDDGVQDGDLLEISVFGVEMVYVPQGAFEIGNVNTFWQSFYTYPTDASSYIVNSEAALSVAAANGKLYYDAAGDKLGPLPAGFPKGYNAFYCMKYEITQEQYVEFLLSLTNTQSDSRAYVAGGNRHGISGDFGTFITSNPYVACNYLSWADFAAYLDWAALRPMTELEYEKACRGTLPSVSFPSSEFAWGTSTRAGYEYTLSNSGADSEGISVNYNIAAGNLSYSNTINGPLRVGVFAAHQSNSGRMTAGATYYGIMEMTGNVYEQIVTVGNPTGRAFSGTHGNGLLAANGNHDDPSWPGIDAVGAGSRGGSWSQGMGGPGHPFYISARSQAATGSVNRQSDKGGRGVRTAP
jgi:formylglycine-generating enzyme required for sulfatase activity